MKDKHCDEGLDRTLKEVNNKRDFAKLVKSSG